MKILPMGFDDETFGRAHAAALHRRALFRHARCRVGERYRTRIRHLSFEPIF